MPNANAKSLSASNYTVNALPMEGYVERTAGASAVTILKKDIAKE